MFSVFKKKLILKTFSKDTVDNLKDQEQKNYF